ncbi:hypothetical protein KAM447_42140 [Aeromonas caviae]|nr:hypothetical protein KAM447_42140 [Aeromonas caviae]
MAIELTHARHDPMHCLAPGLFRSLKVSVRPLPSGEWRQLWTK